MNIWPDGGQTLRTPDNQVQIQTNGISSNSSSISSYFIDFRRA